MNWDWEKLQEKRQRQQSWRLPDARSMKRTTDDVMNRMTGMDGGEEDDSSVGFRFLKGRGNGGTGGGSGSGGDPRRFVGSFPASGIKWVVLGAIAVWLATGIYIVQPDEAGVVLRFGAYDRSVEPGPHYHLPWPH